MWRLATLSLAVAAVAGAAALIYNRWTFDETGAIRIAELDARVWEIETERLVCAVARKGVSDVAISCVPKIPGLFEEPGR